jgi:hypothetical protein
MEKEDASYEVQFERQTTGRGKIYPVQVTPIPAGSWSLRPSTHNYRLFLSYWGMMTIADNRNPIGKSSWTMLFVFREPPMEHLSRPHQDGHVVFLRYDIGPHNLMTPGFTFDLFVDPRGAIAKGQILE